MTNSGTEATMSAIRLAADSPPGQDRQIRGLLSRPRRLLLVKAGSGALTLGQPDSAGIPAALVALTLALPFNDADALRLALSATRAKSRR